MSEPVVPGALAYSQALPAVTGYYWILSPQTDTAIVQYVMIQLDGQAFYLDGDDDPFHLSAEDGNWYSGPVAEPALPEGYVANGYACQEDGA